MDFYMNEYDDFMESGNDSNEARDISLEMEELQMAKLVIGLEATEEMYELNLRAAELQCYSESGSDSDFMAYVEAADKDLDKKAENMIKRLWQKVVTFFENLKEKFFGGKEEDLPDDSQVHMPKVVANFLNKLASLWSAVKTAIANGRQKLSENPKWQKFMLLMATALAALGTTAFVVTTNLDKMKSDFNKAMKEKFGSDDTTMSGRMFNSVRKTVEGMVDFVKGIGKKNVNSESADADSAKEMSTFGSHLNKLLTKVHAPFQQFKRKKAAAGA